MTMRELEAELAAWAARVSGIEPSLTVTYKGEWQLQLRAGHVTIHQTGETLGEAVEGLRQTVRRLP